MNRVVRIVAHTDQILRIEHGVVRFLHLLSRQRIHMVNNDLVVNIPSFDPKIAPVIPNNDFVS